MGGPIQLLFEQMLARKQQEEMAPDPRLRGREFPPPYAPPSDVSAFYGSDVNRSAPPVMPFREQEQAGPAPPLGRLEMAFRGQR
jgi:hypothetical protein